ncbi:peptidase [Cryobacterium sp. PH31-AA6]|uniref:peptidase n=1 Tax=Cryobacterium sp. PH31-AA6 TaxID=3046205 RepID=UPI0024BAF9FE|nr:peptidase [Cryobacterium sp. PH31-AA6]MDJ0322848.1 peptidase [Cryobacterium sp. PH31-AA6]
MINWAAFVVVAVASLLASVVVVSLYSLGLRLLTSAGRALVVDPQSFTGAITVLTPKRAAKEAKRARKTASANPLTAGQKRLALVGAYTCFVLCVGAVLYGVYLIVPALHR